MQAIDSASSSHASRGPGTTDHGVGDEVIYPNPGFPIYESQIVANGAVPVHRVSLNVVRVGEVEVSNVEAIVMPAQMPYVLLGNSFLSRFQMRRDNDVLRLERRR